MRSSNVPTSSSESYKATNTASANVIERQEKEGCSLTFRKGSHQDVDTSRIDAKVIAHSSSTGTESTDRVSLIDVKVELFRGEKRSAAGLSEGTRLQNTPCKSA